LNFYASKIKKGKTLAFPLHCNFSVVTQVVSVRPWLKAKNVSLHIVSVHFLTKIQDHAEVS